MIHETPDEICSRPPAAPPPATTPHAPPIYLSSVYQCADPDQANRLLAGEAEGYVYSRDGNPNADMLAEKLRRLHGAERAVVASSGMGALALAVLSQLEAGDHLIASNMLYGASLELLTSESARLGIHSAVVDTCDLDAVRCAVRPNTRLLVAETITNPCLRVSDIAGLATIAAERRFVLLIDNSFASPIICRPLDLGADLAMESLTKIINGHSDLVLGALCGAEEHFKRVRVVLSRWGLAVGGWDCWLALRGLATLPLRSRQASAGAMYVAEFLAGRAEVERVDYPGLPTHPDHALARRQFGEQFGSMVTFHLCGNRPATEQFIRAVSPEIPFCPSLGEVSTTLSHPQSTSHRTLSEDERNRLGITGGTIRLSVGVESPEAICDAIKRGLGS